jgi:hypothetical protein
VCVAELKAEDKARMFALMRLYYEAVTEEQFLHDLAQKDAVILLREKGNRRIQGFSTLVSLKISHEGGVVHGIFSGDTVIEKKYWGQRVLGKAFLRYLLLEKLRHPFVPLYWLLISKGYKTYLMMANNFGEHFPRYEMSTPPDKRAIADAFYTSLFPQFYNSETGLIRFAEQSCHLKCGVADISPHLLATNPRIAFFQRINPHWQQGEELACIARMTLGMPIYYALKSLVKNCGLTHLLKGTRWVSPLPEERNPAL